MTTLKKIILFLFGILLVVFGNKSAINTIFPSTTEEGNQPVSPDNENNSNISSTEQGQEQNVESTGTKIETDQTEEATATQ